jgi:hypothetical protein
MKFFDPTVKIWKRFNTRLVASPWFSLIIGILFLLGVIIAFKVPKILSSMIWPKTEGVVFMSRIKAWEYLPKYVDMWCPEVSYQYIIDGKTYISNSIDINNLYCSEHNDNLAKKVVSLYPIGKQVQVYYNPKNPTIAVLEPGLPISMELEWILTFIASVVIGACLILGGLLGIRGIVWKHTNTRGERVKG